MKRCLSLFIFIFLFWPGHFLCANTGMDLAWSETEEYLASPDKLLVVEEVQDSWKQKNFYQAVYWVLRFTALIVLVFSWGIIFSAVIVWALSGGNGEVAGQGKHSFVAGTVLMCLAILFLFSGKYFFS